MFEERDESGARRDQPLSQQAAARCEAGETGGIVVARVELTLGERFDQRTDWNDFATAPRGWPEGVVADDECSVEEPGMNRCDRIRKVDLDASAVA
jgi:hypothetical protein